LKLRLSWKEKIKVETSGKKATICITSAQEKETTTMPLLGSDFESSSFDKKMRNEVQDSYA